MKEGSRLASTTLVVLLVTILLPLAWALLASFTPETERFAASLVPAELVLDHYRALFSERRFWLPIVNSLLVAGMTTALCLPLGALCAYALVRMHFVGKNAILAFVLAVTMFPQMAIVSPLYMLLRELRLIDTYPGLVLPYLTFAMPLTVWMLASYFRALPSEIEEAAQMDGASRFRTLVQIVLPLAAPGLATTGILTFIYCWNEFLFALSFTVGEGRRTVPVAIALFRGRYQVPWGEILAAAALASLPVALLVLIFQRRIVGGLTAGAQKG